VIANNYIKEGLLLSVPAKKNSKSVNMWQSYKQEGGSLMHFVCQATTLLKDEEFTRYLKYGEKQLSLTVVTRLRPVKEFENRLRFDRIMVMRSVCSFFDLRFTVGP